MPKITKEAKSEDKKIANTTTKKATATKATKNTESTAKTKVKTSAKKTTTSNKSAKVNVDKIEKKTINKNAKNDAPKVNKKTTKEAKSKIAKSTKNTTSTTKSTKRALSKVTKKVKTASPEDFSVIEYYDLPVQYNKTVVKLLAQTPKTLFVYWDISNDDIENYKKQYGDNFFEITKPVLIIHNDSMNYSFEVDINDFANCWYLNVNDSKCQYRIELGRRPIYNNFGNNSSKIDKDYFYISSSNEIEAPNDHILFDKNQNMVYFKNVKTNSINSKSVSFSYMRNIGKIYNIYDMYQEIYKGENIENYDLSNPSSGNPSSTFK